MFISIHHSHIDIDNTMSIGTQSRHNGLSRFDSVFQTRIAFGDGRYPEISTSTRFASRYKGTVLFLLSYLSYTSCIEKSPSSTYIVHISTDIRPKMPALSHPAIKGELQISPRNVGKRLGESVVTLYGL